VPRRVLRKTRVKNHEKLRWISGFRVAGQTLRLAQPIETKRGFWLRGVDLISRALLSRRKLLIVRLA